MRTVVISGLNGTVLYGPVCHQIVMKPFDWCSGLIMERLTLGYLPVCNPSTDCQDCFTTNYSLFYTTIFQPKLTWTGFINVYDKRKTPQRNTLCCTVFAKHAKVDLIVLTWMKNNSMLLKIAFFSWCLSTLWLWTVGCNEIASMKSWNRFIGGDVILMHIISIVGSKGVLGNPR